MENIDKLAFLGITEKFSESIKRMEYDFGWNLGEALVNNVNPNKDREVPVALLKKIESINEYDKELYAYALEKFNSKN